MFRYGVFSLEIMPGSTEEWVDEGDIAALAFTWACKVAVLAVRYSVS